MTTERERYFHEIPDERFKEWARARHGLPIRPSDGDKQELILGEWAAWQAALAQPAQPVAWQYMGEREPLVATRWIEFAEPSGGIWRALYAAPQPAPAAQADPCAMTRAGGTIPTTPHTTHFIGGHTVAVQAERSTTTDGSGNAEPARLGIQMQEGRAPVSAPTVSASQASPSTPSELSDAECERIAQEVSRKHPNAGDQEYAWECIRAGRATVAEDAARYRQLLIDCYPVIDDCGAGHLNGGRARRLAGESDAGHAGPAGQRNDGQHDDGAAEHGAGLLHSLAHENRSGGNAARVTEEGAVDAAPQPAPAAERSADGAQESMKPACEENGSTVSPPSTLSDADRPKRDAWVGGNSYEASMLRNLLAVIHGDGGHYLEEHGLDKTLEDAEHLVAEWRAGRATVEEVPREPTEAMVQAAYAISDEKRFFIDRLPDYWRAMYDAARGKP